MNNSSNILNLIGKTPIVRLNKIASGITADVFVKLEYLNPSGSLKDRIALRMIEHAEKEGSLRPGYEIVESSTGNTGIALSFVGCVKGYKVVIYETLPGKMGAEKMKIMRNYGADVELIPPKEDLGEKSVAGAEVESPGRKTCLELERTHSNVWWARQFSNPQNVEAQKETAREILSQLDGKVDCFTASIGTGGTLMGIAEVLRKERPNVRIVGIQPASSKVAMTPGKPYPRSEIAGGIVSDMLEKAGLIDEIVRVSDEDAVGMTHRLWGEEGLFAGVSSGANVLVALREAKRLGKGKTVITILPDNADRYLTEEHYVT
ncbi:MAG: cysteine synthase family protein [Candidatus Bathyarchaeia archaeon]|jgi:cysteine synthase A